MNRFFKAVTLGFLAVAAAAGFGLVTSCNIAGSGGAGPTGGLNLLLTDGPTDEWSQVVVVLKSVSLRGNTWTEVWKADAADPAAGKINLVDLSTVVTILQKAAIPVGTYDKLRLVIDTDPATMTLVTDDGATIDPANVTVVDPSGRGEIAVDLEPAVTVEEGKDTNLLVDFDLAHPLAIVNLDGKVILSLKIRHKALPHRLQSIQFARTIGDITAAATDMTTI
ncbi:MAG: putative lipoprotein, partial [Candidatus Aminicenantes bacterium]|nr:putative lipoprotein [Candidatus Aminicenantes bacterium]